ncbi:hypothetical protein [Pseudomonas sp.]|uniref:hypothetical protein n=1 Tax=Pseudomonas sp. TaxID=306 RepID=UPI002614D197|nr:hypothetical protein [Pseudomonas sp.]
MNPRSRDFLYVDDRGRFLLLEMLDQADVRRIEPMTLVIRVDTSIASSITLAANAID